MPGEFFDVSGADVGPILTGHESEDSEHARFQILTARSVTNLLQLHVTPPRRWPNWLRWDAEVMFTTFNH